MPEPISPSRHVLDQIEALPGSDRPLIVCDVDEVILHMASHFGDFLQARGLGFMTDSYKLSGNIAPAGSATPVGREAVRRLVDSFFEEECHRQDMVEGADVALSALADDWDIVLLTNLPGAHNKPVREKLLGDLGIPYPVVTNSGPKGGAVAALSSGRPGPLVFIDDSPVNHSSVNATLPSAIQIQFMADERFRATLEPTDYIALQTGDWHQTRKFIGAILQTD